MLPTRSKSTYRYGKFGELLAFKLLKNAGYKILQKNFRCSLGEIDIIALDKDVLVFVEVKTRWSKRYGKPEEAVDLRKLKKIKLVAEYFLRLNPLPFKKLRIDVVAIELEKNRVVSSKIIKASD